MSETPDLSALLGMLSKNTELKNKIPEEMLSNLMHSSGNSDSSGNNMPDMEMMMKLMKVLQSSNQDSPSKELLKSLKPFLNDNRKEKVDQYIRILGMTKALEMMNELGDKKDE